jgi:hypothetical protein
MEVEDDRGCKRFWGRDKNFFGRQGARGRIEPKDGSRLADFGNWFHAATPRQPAPRSVPDRELLPPGILAVASRV